MRVKVGNTFVLIGSPVCLNQSPITMCNWCCGSGIAGVTGQDFNTPFHGPWTVFVVKVDWLYSPMVSFRVVLGRIVSQIVFTWFPEDFKLTLSGLVFKPK